jgi:hypothetical protein
MRAGSGYCDIKADRFLAATKRPVAHDSIGSTVSECSAMKKIDISIVPAESGGTYPKLLDEPCIAQSCQRLARFAGLTQFGVNVTVIEAGAWSSQRAKDPRGGSRRPHCRA